MKIKNLIGIAILGICFSSCYNLNLQPKGMIDESALFANDAGVLSYFTGLYSYLPIEDFQYKTDAGDGYRSGDPWGNWDCIKHNIGNMTGEFDNSWVNDPNQLQDRNYWPYDHIREVNVFINDFPQYKDDFDEIRYNQLLGEAHFLRAFFYFGLAKYYGGVPIITEVQSPVADIDSLQVHRATEYDTWKFIHDDLQFAIDNMTDAPDVHRASKYTAAALMSRAMLYAGSIAKYSQYFGYQNETAYQQGFVGMTPDKAAEFFGYSLTAGKLIDESGNYSLYAQNSDLVQNYVDVFMDPASKENIFIKSYFPMGTTDPRNTYLIPHTWDAGTAPLPDMSSFVGSESYPTLDFIRTFEFPDNWIINPDGTPKRFDDRSQIRDGLEPRLRGTVYFNGDVLRGVTYQIQRGLYTKFPWQASAIINGDPNEAPNLSSNDPAVGKRIVNQSGNSRLEYYNPADGSITIATTDNPNPPGVRILSDHGTLNQQGGENNCLTGMYIRKYVNYNMATANVHEHMSSQPWIIFRLGEIYLNIAEAAYETGDKTTANNYIRLIRQRAGCNNLDISTNPVNLNQWDYTQTLGAYPIDPGLQYIRDERYRELWGENHRWYDLRRWGVASRVLNRYIPRILSCYYVISEGKYIYLDEREMSQRSWTANPSIYYMGIPGDQINKNPNLLPQNPLR